MLITHEKYPRPTKKTPRQLDYLHLVASVPTSRQQVVFALLVQSCQQVSTTLLTVVTSVEGSFRPHQEAGPQVRVVHVYILNIFLV